MDTATTYYNMFWWTCPEGKDGFGPSHLQTFTTHSCLSVGLRESKVWHKCRTLYGVIPATSRQTTRHYTCPSLLFIGKLLVCTACGETIRQPLGEPSSECCGQLRHDNLIARSFLF